METHYPRRQANNTPAAAAWCTRFATTKYWSISAYAVPPIFDSEIIGIGRNKTTAFPPPLVLAVRHECMGTTRLIMPPDDTGTSKVFVCGLDTYDSPKLGVGVGGLTPLTHLTRHLRRASAYNYYCGCRGFFSVFAGSRESLTRADDISFFGKDSAIFVNARKPNSARGTDRRAA